MRHPAVLILALWAAGLGAAAQFGKISVLYDLLVAEYGSPARVAFMVSVVGMVGAGGIGVVLYEVIRGFQYAQTSAVLLIIILFVTSIDLISSVIRKKFI